jgi:hypothetical protein
MLSITNLASGGVPVKVSRWNLSKRRDRVDVTQTEDTNKQVVQGLPDISGDIEVVWDDLDDNIFDAEASTVGGFMYIYPDFINNPTKYHYGPVWIDAQISGARDGAVTVASSFAASGTWGYKK